MKEKRVFLISVAVFLAIQIAGGVIICLFLDSWSDRAAFGDMFGAVSALFSGLALAGLIWTIYLQQRQLGMQNEELSITREELRHLQEAQKQSDAILKEQTQALVRVAEIDALLLIPVIELDYVLEPDRGLKVQLRNMGNMVAQDVQIVSICYYDKEIMPAYKFLSTYVSQRNIGKKAHLVENDRGFYGVRDHFHYKVLSAKSQIIAPVYVPTDFLDGFYTLLQFRDVQGNNYCRVLWHYTMNEYRSTGKYILGSTLPIALTKVPRLIWDEQHLMCWHEDDGPVPDYISEWNGMWPATISCIFLKTADIHSISWEGRGEWSPI